MIRDSELRELDDGSYPRVDGVNGIAYLPSSYTPHFTLRDFAEGLEEQGLYPEVKPQPHDKQRRIIDVRFVSNYCNKPQAES